MQSDFLIIIQTYNNAPTGLMRNGIGKVTLGQKKHGACHPQVNCRAQARDAASNDDKIYLWAETRGHGFCP